MAWVRIATAAKCVFFTNLCLPYFEPRPISRELQYYNVIGSMAERSKALVLSTSHFDGVGSDPTAASCVF